MARLAAEQRLGFYPASPAAIAELVKHLYCRGPDPTKTFDQCYVIDPCAGRGAAILQIATALGVPNEHIYTVELDPTRGKAIQELIPGGNHLSPCSALGAQITGHSFGLAYVNPPFGDEIGAHRREEQAFVERVIPLLVTKGILVLVLPLTAIAGSGNFIDLLDANFEDLKMYRFPDGKDSEGKVIRAYNEVVIFGRKRKEVLPRDMLDKHGSLHGMDLKWRSYFQIQNVPPLGQAQPKSWNHGSPSQDREDSIHTWQVEHSWPPHIWKKSTFTEDELEQAVDDSPLNKHFTEVKPLFVAEPPLSLDKGHLGLTLASGVLDGVVHGPHGSHVVRGSSYKKQYLDAEATESTVNPESGAVTTKETYRERMITMIRVAVDYPKADIITFSNDQKEEKAEHEQSDDDDE